MNDFLQVRFVTAVKIGVVFVLLVMLVALLGYLAFFNLDRRDDSSHLTQTNILIREKLVYLSNERKSLDKKDRRSHEIIQKAAAITNAPDLSRAIQRFYTLGSNP